jgi:chondroitin AC lyase
MKRFSIILIFLFLFFGKVCVANNDVEILRQRFILELIRPPVNENQVRMLISTISQDGTWAGIDYKDVSKTGFQHREHLSNLVELSRAYKKKGSQFQGDRKLKIVISSALDYWLANDFICENWWWNQIGTPNLLVSVLLIMDDDLTKEQIVKTLPMVGRANLTSTGARPSGDRIKIAGILAKTLLFNRDEVHFKDVIKVIEGEIKFAAGRGMQYDYSFHHREDRVNNTLSYGLGYADAFAEWAGSVSGTGYKFSEPSLQLLIDYYLDGICKMMVYGKFPDTGAMNRDITREGSQKAFGMATPQRLLSTTSYRKDELAAIVKIRKGEARSTLSHSTFFWQSEHFTFQRPTFFTSVRMYSTRDCNMEEPYNGEGLMNHHRGDGTNYISRTGDEYYDIAPVYDWQKIPGTTVLQKPSLPSEAEIQKKGLTDFVGAVTDGTYGAAAFDFKSPHDPLQAKKSWFFFDKQYICLGAGISSASPLTVATTLNQCLLRGEVIVMKGNEKSVVKSGSQQISDVKWILHDSIGYLFPDPQKINLSNQSQSGSWFKVNRQADSPKEEVSKKVFTLWLNHGSQPQNASYQYIVFPSATQKEMIESGNNHEIEILSNTTAIQAVKNSGLGICQIVFYKPAEMMLWGDLKIGIESSGLLMIKMKGSSITQISVADPSRKLAGIHLTVTQRIEKNGDHFHSSWNKEKGISEIFIDLPQSVYAGKSVTVKF